MTVIAGVGHSNKTIEAFIALIKNAGVETLVDVRSRPRSRFSPQFNKDRMSAELEAAGVKYEWRGNNLGGLDGNVNYQETIEELAGRAEAGEHIAVCCSEMHTKDCHRTSMLMPSFHEQGVDFMQILWSGENEMHPAGATRRDEPEQDELF